MKELNSEKQSIEKVSSGDSEQIQPENISEKRNDSRRRSALERFCSSTKNAGQKVSDEEMQLKESDRSMIGKTRSAAKKTRKVSDRNLPEEKAPDGETVPEDLTSKVEKQTGRSGGKSSRSSDFFSKTHGQDATGSGVRRTGSILRLNHPEYSDLPSEKKTLSENGNKSISSNVTPAGKTKVGVDADESKISTLRGAKRAKIKTEQADSGKISSESTSPKTDIILALNRRKVTGERLGRLRGTQTYAAARGAFRRQASIGSSAGAMNGSAYIIVFPVIMILIFNILILIAGLLLPIILVVLLQRMLPENPHDLGVDKMTYLVSKYHGNERNNSSLTGGIGTFGFTDDDEIMELVDYLFDEKNEDGEYDRLEEYTSENRSTYTRRELRALHRRWMLISLLHNVKLLQDQQQYMIEKYYLPEEERIEEPFEIVLDGASYALKGALLSLTFTHPEEDARDELYEDIDWLNDSEDTIIESLYDKAIELCEEEDLTDEELDKKREAWTLECWDALNLFDGTLDIYQNDHNDYGGISWASHDGSLLGIDLRMAPVDNLQLSPVPPTGIIPNGPDPVTGRYPSFGGLASSDIFGPVTGGGYYLDNRMPFLFPAGVPNSPQEMGQYLVDVPCETCNRGIVYITIHRLLAEKVQTAFHEMAEIGFPIDGDTYGYGWRAAVTVTSSGQSFRSHHSYGVVVDINPNKNCMVKNGVIIAGAYWLPGEDPYSVTQEVVDIWKKQGFLWGGEFPDSRDYMHFTFTGH